MATSKKPAEAKPVEPGTKRRLKLADLATDQDFLLGGTHALLNDLPVRKPHRNWFFRVHPDQQLTSTVFVPSCNEIRENCPFGCMTPTASPVTTQPLEPAANSWDQTSLSVHGSYRRKLTGFAASDE